MAKIKIRKGDTVEIISGAREDRGKRGEVIRVLPKKNRVVVQGINIHKKHQSQVQTQGRQMNPGIIEFEAPIDISNVMLIDPKDNKPIRVSLSKDKDGNVIRVSKRSGESLD